MKKIVIIGGGFAGTHAAKKLEKLKKFKVTLIDTKEYFEFTPSILKAITCPACLNKIQVKHKNYLKNSEVILGKVNEIKKNHVHLKTPLKKIPYDYLIISTGSSYLLPFKNHKSLKINRGKDIQKYNKKLQTSNKITIVGGGLVGIELAGEIADSNKYNKKEIKIIQASPNLIPRNNSKSQEYAKKILEKKGIKIMLNKTFNISKEKVISNKNHTIFICIGITPNLNFKLNTNGKKENKFEINKFLQLKKHKNIFIIGDVSNIKEEKTAQNAIRQSNIAVKNIINIEKNNSLKIYISKKTPQLITLGHDKGIFEYKNIVIKGKIPIWIKNFVEKKEMRKLKK